MLTREVMLKLQKAVSAVTQPVLLRRQANSLKPAAPHALDVEPKASFFHPATPPQHFSRQGNAALELTKNETLFLKKKKKV